MPELDPQTAVGLLEVASDNLLRICQLEPAHDGRHVVAPNAASLAEAGLYPDTAYYRAIYANETPVGFIMMWDGPTKKDYFLRRWRGLAVS